MAKIPINLKEGKIKSEQEIIVGIDLGTTNSLVAYMAGDQALAVKDSSGKQPLVPSIIHFSEEGNILVGDQARINLVTKPERTIYSAKRLLGKTYKDIADNTHSLSYSVIEDDTDALVKVKIDQRYYSPIELSAEILKYLKRRIEDTLGTQVSKAVITVPAYFNDTQRQSTKDAGKLAGLDVLRIINEPTAASLAYGLDSNTDKLIAVYDLGGGTFDISILQVTDGIFEVLSTHGNTFLGGDDIDNGIVQYWIDNNNLDPSILSSNKEFGQAIRLTAEKAKKLLSSTDSFSEKIGSHTFTLSRSTFESLIQDILDKTMQSVKQALKDAKKTPQEIDEVVMVGGSTRIPKVKETVAQFFGKKVNDSLNPDEVVALGAAIQADVLAGNNKRILLLDVTPLSMGIETIGGLMDVIVPRNSTIPTKVGRKYTTSVDGQSKLKVAIYQGERDLVKDNRKLGEFVLENIPPMPAGIPKIEVHFIIDSDGILQVRAIEERSKVESNIEIHSHLGLSEEEMGKMLLESIQHAEADMHVKALQESINEAKYVLLASDRFVKQNESLLKEEEKEEIQKLTIKINQVLESQSKDDIQGAIEALNNYTAPLAHKALDKHIGDAIKGVDVRGEGG